MAIKKITFTNANVTAQNDADLYYFLQGGTGILKGIKNEVRGSNNANRFIFEDGYVSIYGRLLFIDSNTDLTIPLNRTAMGYVVLDVNTATNSVELTYTEATNGGYPTLIQENLSTGAGHYQFALAAYSKTGAALTPDQSFKPDYLYSHMERQQGASNAGKVLVVGPDGYIILMNQSGINAGQLEGHPASYFQEKQTGKGLSTNDYDDAEKKKVQDNTTARHSHNNKSILDQVTQDIVNKADKLKFEGEKLSPDLIPSAGINVESADKAYQDGLGRNIADTYSTKDETTAVKNGLEATDKKSLYNLGAFDIVTDNEDGTATITRKTGYLDLGSLNWYTSYGLQRSQTINGIKIPSSTSVAFNGATKNYIVQSQSNISVANAICVATDGSIMVNTSSTPTGILQYELATSYTEKVIKNQRNNYVDDFSRNQWEKSVNLYDTSRKWTKGYYLSSQGVITADNKWQYSDYIEVKSNKTYSASVIKGADTDTARIVEYNSNKEFIGVLCSMSIVSVGAKSYGKGTTTSNTKFIRLSFRVTDTELMLNEGDQALPYQPFDYSGHIQNEQARYLIEHEEDARNLINPDRFKVGDWSTTINENISVLANEKYYIAFNGNIANANIKFYNGSNSLLDEQQYQSGTIITMPNNCSYIQVRFNNNASSSTTLVSNAMLVKSNTSQAYIPYKAKAHITNEHASLLANEEIKTRNLFDKNNVTQGYYCDYSNGGKAAVSGWFYSGYIEVSSSANYYINISTNCQISYYNSSKNYVSGKNGGDVLTTPSNAAYMIVSSTITNLDVIMLNKGTEAQPYEPYAGPIVHDKDLDEIRQRLDSLGFKEGVAVTSGGSVVSNSLKKLGKFVIFSIGVMNASSVTIPEGFRPKTETTVGGGIYTGQSEFFTPVIIKTDGTVQGITGYGLAEIRNAGWETA